MSESILILIGVLMSTIYWSIHVYRLHRVNTELMILEKERSFRAGFDHARELAKLEVRAP